MLLGRWREQVNLSSLLVVMLQCVLAYLLGQVGVSWWLAVVALSLPRLWQMLIGTWDRSVHHTPTNADSANSTDVIGEEGDENYRPEWITQPDVERAEWLNQLAQQVWPQLAQCLKDAIIHPDSSRAFSANLNVLGGGELSIDVCELGRIPPRLDGVQIYEVSQDEVILDCGLVYTGDAALVFNLKLINYQLNIKLAMRNFAVNGKVRIVCFPLLKSAPFFGGLRVSFLSVPDVDFELGGIGRPLELPGFHNLMLSAVKDRLVKNTIYPAGQYFQLVNPDTLHASPDDNTRIRLPAGVLAITIVEAEDLMNADGGHLTGRMSDPFATLELSVDGRREQLRTQVVKNSNRPVWNAQQVFIVNDPETIGDAKLRVDDRDHLTKDDFLGDCVVPASVIRKAVWSNTCCDHWKILDNASQGKIRVKIEWASLSELPPRNFDDQALVIVHINFCENLSWNENRGGGDSRPDPKVKAVVENNFKLTRTVQDSRSPVFDETLALFSHNPMNDDLFLEVIDDFTDSLLGTVSLEITQVLNQESRCLTNQRMELKKYVEDLHSSTHTQSVISFHVYLRYLTAELSKATSMSSSNSTSTRMHRSEKATSSASAKHTSKVRQAGAIAKSAPASQTPVLGDQEDGNDPRMLEQTWTTDGDGNKFFNETPDFSEAEVNQKSEDSCLNNTSKSANSDVELRMKISNSRSGKQGINRSNSLPASRERRRVANGGSRRQRSSSRRRHQSRGDNRAKLLLTLKYNRATSVLSIVIHKAVNLQELCILSLPSPYVKTYLVERSMTTNRRDTYSKRKTIRKPNSANPVFEETIEYCLPYYSLKNHRLEVVLCSRKSAVGKTKELGRTLLDLIGLDSQVSKTRWCCFTREDSVPSRKSKGTGEDETSSVTSLSRASSSNSSARRNSLSLTSLPT